MTRMKMTDDEIEKYKLNMGFSNASNSQPTVDLADRARWDFNTQQAALLDSSKIPPGYYGGAPINMPTYGAGGGSAPKWSELSGAQRRDVVIAFVIAGFFAVGLWVFEDKAMTSIWDFVALLFVSMLVYALSYLALRGIGNLVVLFRKFGSK